MNNNRTISDLWQVAKVYKILIAENKIKIDVANETIERIANDNQLKPIYLW